MKQKELSVWLRAVVIIGWCACAMLAFFVGPWIARDLSLEPEFAYLAMPCLAVFWIGLAVAAIALWFAWRIFGEIGRDNSFCPENARRLRTISRLALADTVLCLLSMGALMLLHAMHPGVFLLMLLIAAVGGGFTVAAAALSHLTSKASALQDENDLTI